MSPVKQGSRLCDSVSNFYNYSRVHNLQNFFHVERKGRREAVSDLPVAGITLRHATISAAALKMPSEHMWGETAQKVESCDAS